MKPRDMALIILVMVVAITVLIAMGKEAETLIAFLMAAIIPTIAVSRVGKDAEQAKENSEQTMHNTNGRMTELIEVNRELITHLETAGVDIDPETLEKHKNYMPEHVDTVEEIL